MVQEDCWRHISVMVVEAWTFAKTLHSNIWVKTSTWKNAYARMVPSLITLEQENIYEKFANACCRNLKSTQPFSQKIFTCVETWNLQYDSETKASVLDNTVNSKNKQTKYHRNPNSKVTLIVFWRQRRNFEIGFKRHWAKLWEGNNDNAERKCQKRPKLCGKIVLLNIEHRHLTFFYFSKLKSCAQRKTFWVIWYCKSDVK